MPASACPDTGAIVPTNLSVLLITSTPLDHIRRNGEWSFRDTLLSRRLPHPLRVYFDYRGRRTLPPPSVPNVTWVNLTAVQPWAQPHISGVLLISAALRLNKPTPQLYVRVRWAHLLLPKALATPLLNRIVGSVYRIPYRNARQAECWTLVYPAAAAINAIGVFVTAETVVDPAAIVAPVLSWHNPGDPTANYEYTKQFVARVPVNRWETVTDSELQHNITGDIQSPSTVDRIVTQGLEFLRTNGCDVVPCGPTSVGPEPAVTRRNGASPKKKR